MDNIPPERQPFISGIMFEMLREDIFVTDPFARIPVPVER